MPNPQHPHSALTGSHLHEPKGVATAADRSIYTANGAASGAWKRQTAGSITLDTADTITTPTAYTRVDSATTGSGIARQVTEGTTASLQYTGSNQSSLVFEWSIVLSHDDASPRDVFVDRGTTSAVVTGPVFEQVANLAANEKRSFYGRARISAVTNLDTFALWVKCAAGDVTVHEFSAVLYSTVDNLGNGI